MQWLLLLVGFLCLPQCLVAVSQASEPSAGFRVQETPDRLVITLDEKQIADFVFRDEKVLRPYFCRVHAKGGLQVTRSHPPVPGTDATDHETMHPGIWLGFGDLSGTDFWRNKGRIEHIRFADPVLVKNGRLSFTTESKLVTAENRLLGLLTCEFLLTDEHVGWRLVWAATFRSMESELTFGDQEEMGFGARVATPLTEKNGGLITSSTGLKTAAATWGQAASWCDYSGRSGDQSGGITLMAAPENFRQSWWHNRDYGVFVANPFGRAAMKQGELSAVKIEPGQSFKIRFAAFIHDAADYDPAVAFDHFAKQFKI